MYTSLMKDQKIILPESMPETSIILDVGAIQKIDLGTKTGMVLFHGNFLPVSQEKDEREWILTSESYLFTSEDTTVQSDTDGLTVHSTESEQCNG